MAAYARAHVIKNLLFKVEATDYSNQVSEVTLTPEQSVQTLKTGVPDGAITDTDSATWTVVLNIVQDFGSGALAKALWDAALAGEDLDCTYQPRAGFSQDLFTFTIRPTVFSLGGQVGQFRTSSVTIPVVGQPVPSQSPSS